MEDDEEIDRLLREFGLELPEVQDGGDDLKLPDWNDDDLEDDG